MGTTDVFSVESIKTLAKEEREKFSQSENSTLHKLKKEFVDKMKLSLAKGIDSFELETPFEWSESRILQTMFFSFLNDIGATFIERYHKGDPADPRDRSYHYLQINCQGV